MKVEYDNYYKTENLFGAPYPELVAFYTKIKQKGKLLDLGCGQGRDAIALAKIGYEVTGVDYSKIGIEQLNKIAKKENLSLKGIVDDIFKFSNYNHYEFVLLDSMFHFGKKEKSKEINLLINIFKLVKSGTLITICIQDTGNKIEILNTIISENQNIEIVETEKLIYKYIDKESNHTSETPYKMITLKKI